MTTPKPKKFLQRLKQHQKNMNRILRDVRISPNRSLLAEIIALWIDADEEERPFIKALIAAQYINSRTIQWKDEEDPPSDGPTKLDLEKGQEIRSAMADVLKGS